MTKPARFRAAVERIAAAFQMVAGVIILATAIGVSVNALARYGLSKDIPFVTEAGGYVFLFVIFLGLAGTFLAGSHIAVELLSLFVPRRVAIRFEEIIIPILSIAFLTVLIIASTVMTMRYYESGRLTVGLVPMPFWIFMAVVPIGSLVLEILLISIVYERLRGDPNDAVDSAGARPDDA
jgi:TRAP-type C4-dicarboxylate transport system permease small subunit